MWPRHIELCLGLWLILSPFIFDMGAGAQNVATVSLLAGAAVVVLSLLAYVPALRRANLVTLILSLALIGWSWSQARPLSYPQQNLIAVGFLLAVMAVCPSKSSTPPVSWRPLASSDRPMH